jgi:hypothetical protein
MKKVVFLVSVVAVTLLTACSGDDGLTKSITPLNPTDTQTPEVAVAKPSTEVFVQGALLDSESATTRDYSWNGFKWPSVDPEGVWEAARFTIRIDGTFPGWLNQDVSKYWGGHEGPNLGKVATAYPYGRYNDRNLDYYKRDKATGENIGLFRYVYDEQGLAAQAAIIEEPSVVEILTYWLNKETSETQNKKNLQASIDGLNDGSLKVLWYVVKEVGMQYGWHVNGILTKNEVQEIGDVEDPEVVDEVNAEVQEGNLQDTKYMYVVPDEVEVDIHQQEHKDWNEIKVSTHIRTDAESVTINLPLDYDNIIEQDDFAIRVYDYYYAEYQVKHEIKHDQNGITITISEIPAQLINDLKDEFGDGLTVEVHSYCLSDENVWNQLKNSTVTTGKACTVKGQITNAFNDEKVLIE